MKHPLPLEVYRTGIQCSVREFFCSGRYHPPKNTSEHGWWVNMRSLGGYRTLRHGNLFIQKQCVWWLGWKFDGKKVVRWAKLMRIGLEGLPHPNSLACDLRLIFAQKRETTPVKDR